jgi:hypothetical protein
VWKCSAIEGTPRGSGAQAGAATPETPAPGEIGKDLAAMALGGGVILVGVDEGPPRSSRRSLWLDNGSESKRSPAALTLRSRARWR